MRQLRFDNAYVRELPADPELGNGVRQVHGAAYSHVLPTPVAAPALAACADEVGGLLGLEGDELGSADAVAVLAGNAVLPGMQPYASCYGGHQFGVWAGQLGDGRAINLGEVVAGDGRRWELQLKGAGPTPYARHADGRAVLRSSLREFICSEAMHHLGVPTTRALSLVTTGEQVLRDMFYDGHPRMEPGAVVCRVSPSFLRFGHYELPAARGDHALLERMVTFTLQRDYPQLATLPGEERREAWFHEVCARTARLMAEWMRVGFVHGVMNTDNMSILGLTIDYGPYGWIDDFDPDWTPNTTDAQHRRYRFGAQPQVAHWNLLQLANALLPLFGSPAPLEAGLDHYVSTLGEAQRAVVAAKLGLSRCEDDDLQRMAGLYGLMQACELDMTLTFRTLAEIDPETVDCSAFADAAYTPGRLEARREAWQAWLEDYAARLRADGADAAGRRARMNAANPLYVPRNYLAQLAIDAAEQGDFGPTRALLDVLRTPYTEQPGREAYAARRPDWARDRPGCSMLSCSS